ncbi:MAG: trehalose-phosphatase [Desulfuromonadaceae bacterium]|nr:trehalose-phosphatase [Desulfuromonadaceae bacterium]
MRIWIFDFDGTLSPIVADRNAAVLHPACAAMLKELSRSSNNRVAVLSSRKFEDILPRVPLDNVIIGGNSGMEWQLPGKIRVSPGTGKEKTLQTRRQELMPLIETLGNKPGIEIEDKQWSVAIHLKKSEQAGQENAINAITTWAERENIPLHRGPNVLEIQLLAGFNKSVGVSFLADLLKVDTQKDSLIYAGDDENDAVAMKWVLLNGGTAIMVGSRLDVPEADYVPDQQTLVDMVRMLQKQ